MRTCQTHTYTHMYAIVRSTYVAGAALEDGSECAFAIDRHIRVNHSAGRRKAILDLAIKYGRQAAPCLIQHLRHEGFHAQYHGDAFDGCGSHVGGELNDVPMQDVRLVEACQHGGIPCNGHNWLGCWCWRLCRHRLVPRERRRVLSATRSCALHRPEWRG